MALETEIKLALSPATTKRLSAHPMFADQLPQQLQLSNTYYDTPDWRLQKKRLAVRFRKKGDDWLLTIKRDAASPGGLARRSEWEAPAQPGQFDFSHVDSPKIRRFLESLSSELVPLFTTDFTRDLWLVTPSENVRVEVAVDKGKIIAGKRQESICEVELELLEGEIGDLFQVALTLQNSLPLHPQISSKAERGYRLTAGGGLSPVKATAVVLEPSDTALAAYRKTVFACLTQLQGNERGLRETDAPEYVHQSRVAIRRLRSAIRVWRPLLPAEYVTDFDPRWRRIAASLGDTRNWDVFIAEILPPLAKAFPQHPGPLALDQHANERLAVARKAAKASITGRAYSHLLLEFTTATLALPESPKPSLPKFAPSCLEKCAKKVVNLARLTRDVAPEARHDLRVALKRLRYALEFFASLLPAQRLERYLSRVTPLLDLLGRLNDLAVAEQLIVSTSDDPPSDLVRGWLAGRSDLMLGELDDRLGGFLGHPTPWRTN